jgi:hypothetical protein
MVTETMHACPPLMYPDTNPWDHASHRAEHLNFEQIWRTDVPVNELAVHAQLYAAAGQVIFPIWGVVGGHCACPAGEKCGSPGKHPCTRNGLHDATDDPDVIRRWWEQHPGANIGLPAHANGYAILDVDPRHDGMESFERLRAYAQRREGVDLLDTLRQNTGSGGLHLLYRAPVDGIKNTSIAFGPDLPGLDTRGNGGYIVTWPSMHIAGGQYAYEDWLREPARWPTALTELMNPAPRPMPVRAASTGDGHGYGQKALDDECETVRSTKEGNRNNQLVKSASKMGQLVAGGHLSQRAAARALLDAAVACGLPDNDANRGTILRGLAHGKTNPRGPVPR